MAAVEPDPQTAAAVERVKIAPDRRHWNAFRDYVVQINNEGVPDDQAVQHLDRLVSFLTFAELDTIEAVNALADHYEARIRALEAKIGV